MEKESYFPTGNQDIDIRIGIEINDQDLEDFCKVNTYVKSICPDIWKGKIYQLYPKLPIPVNYKNRLKSLYFKISRSYTNLREFAIDNNYPEILDWLEEPINQVNFNLEILSDAVIKLKEESVKLLSEYLNQFLDLGFFPIQRTINDAYFSLTYPIKLAEYGLFPNQEVIDDSVYQGRYAVELAKYQKFPSQEIIDIMTEYGNFITIRNHISQLDKEKLESFGLSPFVIDTSNIIKILAQSGIFPSQKAIDIASEKNHQYILKYLAEYNKMPTQSSINAATKLGAIDIVKKLLEKRGIFPDPWAISQAVINNDYLLIEFFAKYNKFPDQYGINEATRRGYYQITELLLKYDKFPDQKAINEAAENGHYQVIGLLAKFNIFPDQKAINMVSIKIKIFGFRDQGSINTKNNRNKVLDILAEYDIFPQVSQYEKIDAS